MEISKFISIAAAAMAMGLEVKTAEDAEAFEKLQAGGSVKAPRAAKAPKAAAKAAAKAPKGPTSGRGKPCVAGTSCRAEVEAILLAATEPMTTGLIKEAVFTKFGAKYDSNDVGVAIDKLYKDGKTKRQGKPRHFAYSVRAAVKAAAAAPAPAAKPAKAPKAAKPAKAKAAKVDAAPAVNAPATDAPVATA